MNTSTDNRYRVGREQAERRRKAPGSKRPLSPPANRGGKRAPARGQRGGIHGTRVA